MQLTDKPEENQLFMRQLLEELEYHGQKANGIVIENRSADQPSCDDNVGLIDCELLLLPHSARF